MVVVFFGGGGVGKLSLEGRQAGTFQKYRYLRNTSADSQIVNNVVWYILVHTLIDCSPPINLPSN